MTTSKCRAKDPANCVYHGTSTTTNKPAAPKVEFEQLTPEEINRKLDAKAGNYAGNQPVIPLKKKPFSDKKIEKPVTKKALEAASALDFIDFVSNRPENKILWPLRRKLDFRASNIAEVYNTQQVLSDKNIPHVLKGFDTGHNPSIEVYVNTKQQAKAIAQFELQQLANAVRLGARLEDRKIKQPIKDLLKRVPKPTPHTDDVEKRLGILKTKAARYGVKLF